MGEMSSIVSRRPSSMNHRNEAFWMSIRLGRSRTCFRREKLLRGRGATTPLLNYEASLENGVGMWNCRRTVERPEPASLPKHDKPAQGRTALAQCTECSSSELDGDPSLFDCKVGQFVSR